MFSFEYQTLTLAGSKNVASFLMNIMLFTFMLLTVDFHSDPWKWV